MALLFSAHAVQLLASYCATFKFGFNWKENLFLAIGLLPKATIQAAIGSTALDIATRNQMGDEFIQLGTDVYTVYVSTTKKDVVCFDNLLGHFLLSLQTLNCAVLAILFFAPIGGVLLMATGKKLLDQPILPSTNATNTNGKQP